MGEIRLCSATIAATYSETYDICLWHTHELKTSVIHVYTCFPLAPVAAAEKGFEVPAVSDIATDNSTAVSNGAVHQHSSNNNSSIQHLVVVFLHRWIRVFCSYNSSCFNRVEQQ